MQQRWPVAWLLARCDPFMILRCMKRLVVGQCRFEYSQNMRNWSRLVGLDECNSITYRQKVVCQRRHAPWCSTDGSDGCPTGVHAVAAAIFHRHAIASPAPGSTADRRCLRHPPPWAAAGFPELPANSEQSGSKSRTSTLYPGKLSITACTKAASSTAALPDRRILTSRWIISVCVVCRSRSCSCWKEGCKSSACHARQVHQLGVS
jgi:hypothetical protein